jgi:hypothetical protein
MQLIKQLAIQISLASDTSLGRIFEFNKQRAKYY